MCVVGTISDSDGAIWTLDEDAAGPNQVLGWDLRSIVDLETTGILLGGASIHCLRCGWSRQCLLRHSSLPGCASL